MISLLVLAAATLAAAADPAPLNQLTPAEKNAISHRGLAFRALGPDLREALGGRESGGSPPCPRGSAET